MVGSGLCQYLICKRVDKQNVTSRLRHQLLQRRSMTYFRGNTRQVDGLSAVTVRHLDHIVDKEKQALRSPREEKVMPAPNSNEEKQSGVREKTPPSVIDCGREG